MRGSAQGAAGGGRRTRTRARAPGHGRPAGLCPVCGRGRRRGGARCAAAAGPDGGLGEAPAEAKQWILENLLRDPPKAAGEVQERPPPNHDHPYDVVIVGAGASGVGMGLMLSRIFDVDPERVVLLERGDKVGESFSRWPKEMRFISPSFNSQGWTQSFDLNSIAYQTAPSYTLQTEPPSGEDYALYLDQLATLGQLNIRFNTQVTAVRPLRDVGGGIQPSGFEIDVAPTKADGTTGWADDIAQKTTLRSRYVVWAAGEFQYPKGDSQPFQGAELCRHNSSIRSWKELAGDDFVVIGGYESGMDAFYSLAKCGKHCTVVSSTDYLEVKSDDPSLELAPYTMERVRDAFKIASEQELNTRLLAPLRVSEVVKKEDDGYVVKARCGGGEDSDYTDMLTIETYIETTMKEGTDLLKSTILEGTEVELHTSQPPLLCTGFAGSVAMGVAKDLFEWGGLGEGSGCLAGSPLLGEHDESTKTPGLFLVGPAVRQQNQVLCFVYKFRQRFGIVADAIARGLGHDTRRPVQQCRATNMFLDDFSCCKGACGESC